LGKEEAPEPTKEIMETSVEETKKQKIEGREWSFTISFPPCPPPFPGSFRLPACFSGKKSAAFLFRLLLRPRREFVGDVLLVFPGHGDISVFWGWRQTEKVNKKSVERKRKTDFPQGPPCFSGVLALLYFLPCLVGEVQFLEKGGDNSHRRKILEGKNEERGLESRRAIKEEKAVKLTWYGCPARLSHRRR
jgi:hypothetical protein